MWSARSSLEKGNARPGSPSDPSQRHGRQAGGSSALPKSQHLTKITLHPAPLNTDICTIIAAGICWVLKDLTILV